MTFTYAPELLDYMKQKHNSTILVEVVEVNNSDLEITELVIRLADAKTKDTFLNKKGYRLVATESGEVLLPKYPLTYGDTVHFALKKILFFKQITCKGISVPRPL